MTPNQAVQQATQIVRASAPADLPSKPFWQSNAAWASIITFLLGVATQFGLPQWVAEFAQTNVNTVYGAIMTLVGVYGAWATARRNSKITL